MTVGGVAQYAQRIRRAALAVEALDELRADAVQEPAGERYTGHLALDDEPEAGRKGGGEYQSVEVARVVGDDHTLSSRQLIEGADGELHARSPKEGAGERPRGAPAPVEARQQQGGQRRGQPDQQKQSSCVKRVCEPERKQGDGLERRGSVGGLLAHGWSRSKGPVADCDQVLYYVNSHIRV